MKCQGRPDGICPDNRNDDTVHNTIADLFLCHACEEYRWPSLSSKKASKGGSSDTTGNKSSRKQKLTTNNVSANTRGREKASQKNECAKAKDVTDHMNASDDEHGHRSYNCQEDITGNNLYIKCSICCNEYHQRCSGLSEDVFSILLNIVAQSGWVCRKCRRDFNGLKSELR